MNEKKSILVSGVHTPSMGSKSQLEEFGARFFYAAATLPPTTVEGILGLLEACCDSDAVQRSPLPGGRKVQ